MIELKFPRKLRTALAGILCLSSAAVEAGEPAGCDAAALELGRRLLSATVAIRNPHAPGAMQAIIGLGTDSHFYTMVKGRLAMQLRGDQSIVAGEHPNIVARISFLKQAMRAIDLE